MKSLKMGLLFLFASVASIGFSNEPTVMTVNELEQERLACIAKSAQDFKFPDIVEFPAGTVIPIDFEIKGDLIALNTCLEEQALEILQKLYVKFTGESFLISSDGIEWKELPDFITGSVGFGFSFKKDYDWKPRFTLYAEFNQRTSQPKEE